MKPRAFLCVFVVALLVPFATLAESPIEVASPNGELVVTLDLADGIPNWALTYGEKELIEASRLGVQVDSAGLGAMESVSAERTTHREPVDTVWGKFAQYDDHYRQLCWTLRETTGKKRTLQVLVRVYDQGMAFRYEFPEDGGWGEKVTLTDGVSEFRFAGDSTAWAYHREHDPYGPQPLSKFHGGKGAELPMTVECGPDAYLAVLEAAVFEQAPFRLASVAESSTAFRATFPKSTLPAGGATSWRVVLVGEQPGDLLVGPVLFCLNRPCAIDNTDWIKPGLAFWDWRAWGATTKDDFKYDLDMESWRRFIDFASNNNVSYLVLDANWYGPEFEASSDPRTSRDHLVYQPDMTKPQIARKPAPADWGEPIDVPALIRYGKERNVGIILYFNDIARFNYPFEKTLALYQKWGAAGIKYGFMKAKGQQKVLDTREIVRLCAKHQLLCNFHDGPIPPSGDERTYPNYVTREFCHSQSDAMRVFSPRGFCEQVFVNMLAGPLDMCNGLYALENPARDRPRIFTNVEATVAAETARVLITYSGFSILPDCPEAYEEKGDLFDFIRRLPMTWDETRILHSSIGNFIATARRSGENWFVASATNEEARTLPISLDFLADGRTYTATLYEDAPDSHFQTNREAYRVRQMPVTRGMTLPAQMAPGGGHCVFLRPE
jgi:glycosyl hydrolase family 97